MCNKLVPRKIGQKTIRVFPESQALNKWIDRPACTEAALPLKGALNVFDGGVRVNKKAPHAIGYLANIINDVQHNDGVFFVSESYGGGNGLSITPNIFEKSIVLLSVRKLIKGTWTNDRDQYAQPTVDLPEEFITNCAVWNLFHGSNQTSSLKDVKYNKKTYQVRNQFFPYSLEEVESWETPIALSGQFRTAKDTFVAEWLKGRTLSLEAKALLDAGREVYQVFYKEFRNLNRRKFKIDYWDVGWYQVRNALLDAGVGLAELNAVKEAHIKLTKKLQPKVYEYGFLDQEILYTEEV
jgi:hypothetical protein